MSQVISASRRTDIPGFYSEWFVNRLKAGFVYVQQPYNGRIARVSLKANDVSAFFFCSKNYRPMLDKLEAIEKTSRNLFFHFTITANREFEFNTPDHREAIRDYIYLARRYSRDHIIWRYDPICITDKLPYEAHEERFLECAELLKGHVNRCTISFVHPYRKVIANFKKYSGHTIADLSTDFKRQYADRLAKRAAVFGIQLYACCNDYLVSESILKGSCIDGGYMSGLFQASIDTRAAATRKECGCTKSLDIGAYDTCAHECVYCYANMDKNKARATQQKHNPEWNSLRMQVHEEIKTAGAQAAFNF